MEPAAIKETIFYEDFEKLDIRVGTITSVSYIEKSNKLMKLTVTLVVFTILCHFFTMQEKGMTNDQTYFRYGRCA